MKILTVTSGWHAQEHFIRDDAAADAAYEAIRKSMDEYHKYGNDKDKSVTVTLDASSTMTFRIDSLASVGLLDCAVSESTIVEREVWRRSVDAKIAARLAPHT